MTVEEMVADALRADLAITGVVGDRIYPIVADDPPVTPFITYRRTAGEQLETSDGPLDDEQVTIEVRCVGDSMSDAKRLQQACRECLQADADLDATVKTGEDIPGVGASGEEGQILYVAVLTVETWL